MMRTQTKSSNSELVFTSECDTGGYTNEYSVQQPDFNTQQARLTQPGSRDAGCSQKNIKTS